MIDFISSEGTNYIWEADSESILHLTPFELQLIKAKVSLMSDRTILNRISGNNKKMGIPLKLTRERINEVKKEYRRVLERSPEIIIESHAIDRLMEDWLLDDSNLNKRGWESEADIRECVKTMKQIIDIRLNINHGNKNNTDKIKYLHPQPALTIIGEKRNENGRLVTAVLNKDTITVITIL